MANEGSDFGEENGSFSEEWYYASCDVCTWQVPVDSRGWYISHRQELQAEHDEACPDCNGAVELEF